MLTGMRFFTRYVIDVDASQTPEEGAHSPCGQTGLLYITSELLFTIYHLSFIIYYLPSSVMLTLPLTPLVPQVHGRQEP
jgi:hypothetical protein